MLFCAAIAIAANFATVAVANDGHGTTESEAEKAIDTLADTVNDTSASLHAEDIERTQVVKREARCLNLEKLVNI